MSMFMDGRKKTLKTLAVFVGGTLIVTLILGLIIGIVFPEIIIEELTLGEFTWTILLQHAFFLIVLVMSIVVYVGKDSWVTYLKQRRQRKGWKYMRKYVVGGWLFYVLGMIALGAIVQTLGWHIPGLNGEQGLVLIFESFALNTRRKYLLMFILISVLTPLVEELIYRTFLTDLLSRHGAVFGIATSALIFALSHLEGDVVINLFILGLILGYIYHKTKSGWYPFFFHLIINTMSLLILFVS